MKNYNMIITAISVDTKGEVTWHKEELCGTLRQGCVLLESLREFVTQAYLLVDGEIISKLK